MYSFFVQKALAAGDVIGDLDAINPLGERATLLDVINRVFDWLLRFAAVLVPIIIVWGAFQILTAQGEAEKFKTGKMTIFYAVLGFIIILMAKGVVSIIKDVLTG